MSHTSQLFLTVDRYLPDHAIYDNRPYIHHSTKIQVDLDNHSIEITYNKEKDELRYRHTSKAYLYFEQDPEILASIFRFLSREKPNEDGQSESLDINIRSGILRTRKKSSGQISQEDESHVDLLRFSAMPDRIVVEAFEGNNPVIFYHERERGKNPQDNNNLEKLQNFSLNILDDLVDDEYPIEPVPNTIKIQLRSTKYGNEVLEHIRDGNSCLRQELTHPALNCYIHAIEWTIITYLESEENLDIIEREKDGQLYYFAERSDSLLNELEQYADPSQKTVSKIEEMNRMERRWSAHHKSGEISNTEINAIHSRLLILLDELFESED